MSKSVFIVGALSAIIFCIAAMIASSMNWLSGLMKTVRIAVIAIEAVFAIVFFIKNLDREDRDTHPLLSVISSILCITASYFVLMGLSSYSESGKFIYFVIQTIVFGGVLFTFVLPGWITLNNSLGRWGLLSETFGIIILVAIYRLIINV